jgi:hypothetical protein
MRALRLAGLTWLALTPLATGAAEPRRQAPEKRALAYLAREVPAWSVQNRCYSCHNNGDGARALYTAVRLGIPVAPKALADTTRWLTRPERWDHNRGDKRFSDKHLARLQFAAALAEAIAAAQVKERKPLLQATQWVARRQRPDGSWQLDAQGNVGSPVTYGTALGTYLARDTLQKAGADRYRRELARADRWFRRAPVRNVLAAAAVLLGLGEAGDEAALAQRKKCLALIRKGQSRDGGWGPYVNAASEPFDTAVVLLALRRHAGDAAIKAMLQRGRAYLIAVQEEDGSWPETTRPAGEVSYAQHVSTTGWATLALLATK